MLGSLGISFAPISSITTFRDFDQTPFEQLINDPTIERVFLFETQLDIGTSSTTLASSSTILASDDNILASEASELSGVQDLNLATHKFATDTEGVNDTIYLPLLKNPLNFAVRMFNSKQLTGRSRFGAGDITLINAGCCLDPFLNGNWDNGEVTIKLGSKDMSYTDFGTIFIGKAESITYDEKVVNVRIRDSQIVLDRPVQETTFAGTGGLEGGAELAGKPKPLCYGKCLNIEPILVDTASSIYMIHNGAIEAVDEVYFAGLAATLSTDYTVNLSQGTITLLVDPGGTVTADVRGANIGGYISSAADICKQILKDQAGFVDNDFDLGSFAFVNAFNNSVIGHYTGLGEPKLSECVDSIVTSVGGHWGFNRLNKFFIGIIRQPGTPTSEIVESEIERIRRIETPLPPWITDLSYQKNWTVMNPDRLAGGVSEDRKQFLGEEFRVSRTQDSAVKTRHPLARHFNLESLIDSKVNADAESSRLQTLHGTDRDFFEIELKNVRYDKQIGDRIKITHSRFGLSAGKNFILVGFDENARRDTNTIVVWG